MQLAGSAILHLSAVYDGASYDRQYAVNTSGTTAPTTGWASTRPSPQAGKYIWMRERIANADGTYGAWETAVCLTGDKGDTGATGEQGPAGTDGGRWYTGTAITGTSATATIFSSSGITSAVVGDMYLNISNSNTYRCTVAGAASVAKWVYVANVKGGQGSPGVAGGRWYSGTGVTGTSTTATIFSGSGVPSAVVGDMYLNTATSNTYRCTVAGAASAAKWVYVANIKGDAGAPAVDFALSAGMSTYAMSSRNAVKAAQTVTFACDRRNTSGAVTWGVNRGLTVTPSSDGATATVTIPVGFGYTSFTVSCSVAGVGTKTVQVNGVPSGTYAPMFLGKLTVAPTTTDEGPLMAGDSYLREDNIVMRWDGVQWTLPQSSDDNYPYVMQAALSQVMADRSDVDSTMAALYGYINSLMAKTATLETLFAKAITLLSGGSMRSEGYNKGDINLEEVKRGFYFDSLGYSEWQKLKARAAFLIDATVSGSFISEEFSTQKANSTEVPITIPQLPVNLGFTKDWFIVLMDIIEQSYSSSDGFYTVPCTGRYKGTAFSQIVLDTNIPRNPYAVPILYLKNGVLHYLTGTDSDIPSGCDTLWIDTVRSTDDVTCTLSNGATRTPILNMVSGDSFLSLFSAVSSGGPYAFTGTFGFSMAVLGMYLPDYGSETVSTYSIDSQPSAPMMLRYSAANDTLMAINPDGTPLVMISQNSCLRDVVPGAVTVLMSTPGIKTMNVIPVNDDAYSIGVEGRRFKEVHAVTVNGNVNSQGTDNEVWGAVAN